MSKMNNKLDMAARAAWMYYIAGKTQHDIADILGVSRQVVQRLVATSMEKNVVSFHIHHPIAACTALASALEKRYQLQLCQVVPSGHMDSVGSNRMIAVAGAEVMTHYLSRQEPMVIAVGSGKMLRNTIEQLHDLARPQHSCVALIGAIAADGSCTRYDVPLWMAEKTQGKYFILPAPLFADSVADQALWCHHRIYQTVTEKAAMADVTFIGIGEVGFHCPLHVNGFVTTKEISELQKINAVAEILGHFFNAQGELIPGDLQNRLTSVAIRQNPQKPVIAFAGGKEKHQAIEAVLRGHWINGLVTDEETARRILFNTHVDDRWQGV